jgi:hypothetical protein
MMLFAALFIENSAHPFCPIFILTDNYLESVRVRLETVLMPSTLVPMSFHPEFQSHHLVTISAEL